MLKINLQAALYTALTATVLVYWLNRGQKSYAAFTLSSRGVGLVLNDVTMSVITFAVAAFTGIVMSMIVVTSLHFVKAQRAMAITLLAYLVCGLVYGCIAFLTFPNWMAIAVASLHVSIQLTIALTLIRRHNGMKQTI